MKKWLIILAFALLAAGNVASAVDHYRWQCVYGSVDGGKEKVYTRLCFAKDFFHEWRW